MAQIQTAQLEDERQFARVKAILEADHPGLILSVVKIEGEGALRSEHGGMRVFWLHRGAGEVFLPKGYRTQEGDGGRLPEVYQPDSIDPAFADTIQMLKSRLSAVSPAALEPLRAIVGRMRGAAFVGDIAGDLWKLEQAPRPWSQEAPVEAAIASLFSVSREHGYSSKQVDSYEALNAGDQVIACGQEAIRVRGQFECLALEKLDRKQSHVSTVRRLPYLLDTSGGCNPDFVPFRRLPLTWYSNYPGETGDGLNFANSHVVNIPKETSPTHFHPVKPIHGGLAQTEMYLVLDPATYQLNTSGRPASLLVFPDLRDLRRYEQHSLSPGTFVYIPPGTGHRGLDVFVNVLTIPGFKPHNEYYLDREICDVANGASPYNENFPATRNYTRLEDLLA
jgi:hypothetical protein